MPRFTALVDGFFNDFKGEPLQKEKIQVDYSADKFGKTLSLASAKHDVQITIPFDQIIKLITEV